MINAYDWEDALMLVIVKNRHGTVSWLLEHASQAEFFEAYRDYWIARGAQVRDLKIDAMTVEHLTRESFDLLEPSWPDEFKVGV